MLDFVSISTRLNRGHLEIYPKFIVRKSKDLMIRGGDFYAVWVQEKGMWSTDEQDCLDLIDAALDEYMKSRPDLEGTSVRVLHLWDAETGIIDRWHKYCQRQVRDNYKMLDETVIFSNAETKRENYASKKLSYPLESCDISSYDRLMSVLYAPEERHKIEWAIGSIVDGRSKEIQKFLVLYGPGGTGKSTVLHIIEQLFDGYYTSFSSKALTSMNAQFALEDFRSNPLVAIEHDGDLSRIEDNTRLNSIVSHEEMSINEKFKSSYVNRFKCFIFVGTNKPVKITDSRSGVIRRLIDVFPSGNKVPKSEYNRLMKSIKFELGGIAKHCLEIFQENPDYYDDYIPFRMMDASNDFYNFMLDIFYQCNKDDEITLNEAWTLYKNYCEEANVLRPYSKRIFKEELKNYFVTYEEKVKSSKGGLYSGFKSNIFKTDLSENKKEEKVNSWIVLKEGVKSNFDEECGQQKAQYANAEGIPQRKWDSVKTTLSSLDTKRLHYCELPSDQIVIDFDLKDDSGNKSLLRNLDVASNFPKTYVEVSKSGCGLHLHYIYTGDINNLASLYADGVEIKRGRIRRQLTQCNDIPIATISSGLPLKEVKKVLNKTTIKTENSLRKLIIRNLNKEIHNDTSSSIDFIKALLDDAYQSGMKYDLRDMRNDIFNFAQKSTNQAQRCLNVAAGLHFCSKEYEIDEEIIGTIVEDDSWPMVFFDIEVFPNLFMLCYKIEGDNPVVKLMNPDPKVVREFCSANYKRIGFNCRRYDNHLIYAYAYRNYTPNDIFKMSTKIINQKVSTVFIGEAYNLSYTDIYDFASAGNKKSLKKLEIEMGIHHQEFNRPWDKPLDEKLWNEAAAYCENDVIATEAAFHYLKSDWQARLILSDIAGMSPNSTTNQLSTAIIFGLNKNPQGEFNYRDMSKPVRPDDPLIQNYNKDYIFYIFDDKGQPTDDIWTGGDIPEGYSVLPYFPGYEYSFGKSTYKGYEVGEGGFVYADPGMYNDISLLDIASMHPSSVLSEVLFGPRYTDIFRSIVELRLDIKHGEFSKAETLFDGKLKKYFTDKESANGLADALKTVINSVYGLTSASFANAFKDQRNVDNIVAKRGALFMIDLLEKVKARGYHVVHIKTDSIKIAHADDYIRNFVYDYGKKFGYTFEFEAVYDRMCLVNDAVYIARYDDQGVRNKGGKKASQWTATGKQFAVPVVFKSLFSNEEMEFSDFCETFNTTSSLYLDINELLPDVSAEEKELKKIDRSDPLSIHRINDLKKRIEKGHGYKFVGRTGLFTPIKEGNGGGILYRIGEDKYGDIKYSNVSGGSGYRWLESEVVKANGLEDQIDMGYFHELVGKARDAIAKYGDVEAFVSGLPFEESKTNGEVDIFVPELPF